MTATLHSVFGFSVGGGGVSYTLSELLGHVDDSRLAARLWCPHVAAATRQDFHRPLLGTSLWRVAGRLGFGSSTLYRATRSNALRKMRRGDVLYAWPPYDIELISHARRRGLVVVGERINCMGATCKAVLEPAYARFGAALPPGWCTADAILQEVEQMQMCDYVTAPNDFVARSLREAGIAQDRILPTAYGWSPERLASASAAMRPQRSQTVFLFVGLGIVRKGLDILLECWEKAGVNGLLKIAGRIDADLRRRCARQLARPDVVELGYVKDIGAVYAEADVFVFPSHEEGGPQVVYEAAGSGLPCLVSPMGAGRVIRHDINGLVHDPMDESAWVDALRQLSLDTDLRLRLGSAASDSAQHFTWQRVGERLRGQLLDIVESRASQR